MGKCKTCGKNAEGDYCFQHKPRKALKIANKMVNHQRGYNVTLGKLASVIKEVLEERKTNFIYRTDDNGEIQINRARKMHAFFLEIWSKRPHKSELSGEYLGKEPLSAYFHHILPKSKYPDLAFIEENIILLTLDEHANVESDIYKYEKINKIRTELTLKYLTP